MELLLEGIGLLKLYIFIRFCFSNIGLCLRLCSQKTLVGSIGPWNKLVEFVYENTNYWVMKQVLSTRICVCVDRHKTCLCFPNVPSSDNNEGNVVDEVRKLPVLLARMISAISIIKRIKNENLLNLFTVLCCTVLVEYSR